MLPAQEELREANEKLILAGLREQALAARARRSAARVRNLLRRERLLARASALLGSSLNHERTLPRLAQLIVPALADWFAVSLADGGGLASPLVSVSRPASHRGAADDRNAIQPEVTRHARNQVLRNRRRPIQLPLRAPWGWYLGAPLRIRNRTAGVLSLVRRRQFQDEEIDLVDELAHLIAVSLDNAQLYEEARAAVRMRDDVLAAVSHDMAAPVSSVDMLADLLLTQMEAGEPAGAFRRPLELVRACASEMRALNQELSELAAIQHRRLQVNRAPQDVVELIEHALRVLEPVVEDKFLQVVRCVAGGIDTVVACDRRKVTRLLGNLLGNAVKFTPPRGRITVTVERDADCLRVSVADTGPGIDEADVARVFEPYWRAPGAMGPGSGLGLFVARGIVHAHGGRLWVKSESHRGSTFVFTLPAQPR